MTGRAEIDRQKRRLDATFQRAASLGADPELLSDFARYLCLRVSGFLEQAAIEIALEHVRTHSSPSVLRHMERRLRNSTNMNTARIVQLFGSFNADWQRDLELMIVDERKAAVDSVVGLRHIVAHGGNAGITMARVREYYELVKDVIEYVEDLCIP